MQDFVPLLKGAANNLPAPQPCFFALKSDNSLPALKSEPEPLKKKTQKPEPLEKKKRSQSR